MILQSPEALISPEYRRLQIELHEREGGYGRSGTKHAEPVINFATLTGSRSILDYGCGEGFLKTAMLETGWTGLISEYDPCIPDVSGMPAPADIVVCTDVLEHVEPGKLDAVLAHIAGLALKHAYILVSTVVAGKTLSDGRNAHLIVQDATWWRRKLEETGLRITRTVVSHKDATFWIDSDQ